MGRAKKKNELLSKEEELALGKYIYEWRLDKENDEKHKLAIEAAQKLFSANQRFAFKAAYDFIRRTQTRDYDIEDAKIDACIGLMTAIWRYDYTRNTKITTVARMPILKELTYKCNKEESLISFKNFTNIDYAKAKKMWIEEGLEDKIDLKDYVKMNQDKFPNLTHDKFIATEDILKGISSLDYSVLDKSGHPMDFKDVIEDRKNLSYYDFIDNKNTPSNFSENILNAIKENLTPLQQEIIKYEYNDFDKTTKEEFLTNNNITQRIYTRELNLSIKALREHLS